MKLKNNIVCLSWARQKGTHDGVTYIKIGDIYKELWWFKNTFCCSEPIGRYMGSRWARDVRQHYLRPRRIWMPERVGRAHTTRSSWTCQRHSNTLDWKQLIAVMRVYVHDSGSYAISLRLQWWGEGTVYSRGIETTQTWCDLLANIP
jgi:hypothetical protein